MIKQLQNILATLKNSLPNQAPLIISEAIDPSRALILRETCLYRITELTESAYEAFKKGNLITAFILSRAIMETESLFWSFLDEVEKSIKIGNIEKVRDFLSQALTGARASLAKEAGRNLKPPHVLELVRDQMGKKISHYFEHYEVLSEFSHPNAAGLNETYARIDYDQKKVFFGVNKERVHENLALGPLVGSLEAFIIRYDASAKLMEEFIILCEEIIRKMEALDSIKVKENV